jgi:hypothetical protein
MYNLTKLNSTDLATITDTAQAKVNRWTKLQLDGDKLQSLANTSQVVGEFFDYLDHNKKDKTFLDNLLGHPISNGTSLIYALE